MEGAGVVLDQGPAPAGGSGEAQAGGKTRGAEPEEGAGAGAAEEETRAAEMEAPDEALGQMLQVCEQDMSAIDLALPELRRLGGGGLTGKRKGEEALVDQPVRHSLWGQGPLGAGFYVRQGWTGGEGIWS